MGHGPPPVGHTDAERTRLAKAGHGRRPPTTLPPNVVRLPSQSLTGEGVLKGGKFASKIKVAGPKIRNFSVDKIEVASKGTFKAEASLKAIIEGLDVDFA